MPGFTRFPAYPCNTAGQDINAEMVRRGATWAYRRHCDDSGLLRLEQAAQAQKRGLWALPKAERVPPWEWRAAEHRR